MAQVDIDIKSVLTIGCVCIFVVAVSSFYLGGKKNFAATNLPD